MVEGWSCAADTVLPESAGSHSQEQWSDSVFTFNAQGGNASFRVQTEGSWSLLSLPDWIEFAVTSGFGDSTVTFEVQENLSEELRSDTVFVTAPEMSKYLLITQSGAEPEEPAPIWELPPIEFVVPAVNSNMRELSSVDLTREMGLGWNLGNSLEAIGGETAWGNAATTKRLIDSVKSAGFTAIRIPVAWSKFSNVSNYTIQTDWLNRVKEVVNYALENEMYVILNNHWDGGWMNNPVYEQEYNINSRLYTMWTQIASHFRDYNDYLLFAGTNEVLKEGDNGIPTREYYTVQNGFNQTFVNAVRSTGGRNVYRHLVIQGFNTNIDHTISFAEIPKDTVEQRLIMEVHYYDPYDFTLKEDGGSTQWGEEADQNEVDYWGQEDHADRQFSRMQNNFVRRGIGVIVGEYGAISKPEDSKNAISRAYYNAYITQSMITHELVPFYWDNGHFGEYGFAVFDRNNGVTLDTALLEALINQED